MSEVDRRNDRRFADALLEELVKHDYRTAMLRAGRRMGWRWQYNQGFGLMSTTGELKSKPYTDRQVLKRAKKILDRDGVVAYLGDLYQARRFSPLEGVDLVIKHMRGYEIDQQKVTKDGDVVTYTERVKPSLEATKFYFSQTTEEQAKRVQVDTRMLVSHHMNASEPPRMRARVLKDAPVAIEGK